MTTYQERFAEACKTNRFQSYPLKQGPDSGYLVWDVQHVRAGQKVTIDGPFFTEEEARVSADLLRGTFRGARAYQGIYDRIWNYDPQHEQMTVDQARRYISNCARCGFNCHELNYKRRDAGTWYRTGRRWCHSNA